MLWLIASSFSIYFFTSATGNGTHFCFKFALQVFRYPNCSANAQALSGNFEFSDKITIMSIMIIHLIHGEVVLASI